MTRAPARVAVTVVMLTTPFLGCTPAALAQSAAAPDNRADAVERGGVDGRNRVEQPERSFGRLLGDVLVQRVRLAAGETVDAAVLPPEGRVDAWFARLPSLVTGGEGEGRHVELRYQLVNSPLAAAVVSLPATELAIVGGDPVSVAPWPVAIAPLLSGASGAGVSDVAASTAEALPAMRPDRRLPPLDTAPQRERARWTGLALGVILVIWALWWGWRRRRDAVRLPFSRASSALRRLDAGRREENPVAWRAAHAALNATAGQVSGIATIDVLLARASWLRPYRERLVAFHDASDGRFFEQPPRAEPFALQAFVRDLERAERREAR